MNERVNLRINKINAFATVIIAVSTVYIAFSEEQKDRAWNWLISIVQWNREVISVELDVPKNELFLGENLVSFVNCKSDCYLRVYHIGKNLMAMPIFPQRGQNNFVKKNGILKLPKLEITLPYGMDYLIVVASPKQFDDLHDVSPVKVSDVIERKLLKKGVPESAQVQVGYAMRSFSVLPKK